MVINTYNNNGWIDKNTKKEYIISTLKKFNRKC